MSPYVILNTCDNEICGVVVIALVEFDIYFLLVKVCHLIT